MANSTAKAESLIRLDGVDKRFANGTVALHNLSLDIGQRQFISFLGASGCGKSTALRMIAGLTMPTTGSIEWGKDAAATGKHVHDIGFVFQEPTLMPWATVFENVFLPLKLVGTSRKAARPLVEEALEQVGLANFANVYPRELSGGMKMRVSIARAMVTRPRVLLMDEPFAALDEMTRVKLNNDVLRLWQEHDLTVIFVTHSVWESVYLSNRIIVMATRPGRVVDDIAIPAPYPRDEDFRVSAEYVEYCKQVSKSLRSTLDGTEVDH